MRVNPVRPGAGIVGLGEMVRSASRTAFTNALRNLVPEIRSSDLALAQLGAT